MSLSNILCKTKICQTWNEKCLTDVVLGFNLPCLKSAPLNYAKCKVPRKDKDL